MWEPSPLPSGLLPHARPHTGHSVYPSICPVTYLLIHSSRVNWFAKVICIWLASASYFGILPFFSICIPRCTFCSSIPNAYHVWSYHASDKVRRNWHTPAHGNHTSDRWYGWELNIFYAYPAPSHSTPSSVHSEKPSALPFLSAHSWHTSGSSLMHALCTFCKQIRQRTVLLFR